MMTVERSSIAIREARDGERAEIVRLTRAAYAEYGTIMSPAGWAGLSAAMEAAIASSEPAVRLVADDAGKIVGSAMLYAAHSNAYGDESKRLAWPEVRLVVVALEARGRGVARLLMEDTVRRARAAGASALGIHTSASMRAAMRLYKNMGFERVPERDFHPPGAELVEAFVLKLG